MAFAAIWRLLPASIRSNFHPCARPRLGQLRRLNPAPKPTPINVELPAQLNCWAACTLVKVNVCSCMMLISTLCAHGSQYWPPGRMSATSLKQAHMRHS